MSDPTPTPTPDPTPDPTPKPDPTPIVDDEPLGEPGKKALQSERARASAAEKERDALKAQLDAHEKAKLSELERAQAEAAEAKQAATKSAAEALRYRVAAAHGISTKPGDDGEPSDAELFLTGVDEATLEKQASRWAERNPSSNSPRPDPSQGGKPAGGVGSTPEGDFASFLKDQLS